MERQPSLGVRFHRGESAEMAGDTRQSARAFVRSLNILLKFARLYEFGHVRTMAQFETAWKELHAALQESRDGR